VPSSVPGCSSVQADDSARFFGPFVQDHGLTFADAARAASAGTSWAHVDAAREMVARGGRDGQPRLHADLWSGQRPNRGGRGGRNGYRRVLTISWASSGVPAATKVWRPLIAAAMSCSESNPQPSWD
jgi:hypothetical protein